MTEYRLSAHSVKNGNIELETGYIFLDEQTAIKAYNEAVSQVEEYQGLAMNIRFVWEQRPMYDIIRAEKIECEDGDEVYISLIEVERPVEKRNMRYVVMYDKEAHSDDFICLFEVGMSLLKGSETRSELLSAIISYFDKKEVMVNPDDIDKAINDLAYTGIGDLDNRFVLSTEDITGLLLKKEEKVKEC